MFTKFKNWIKKQWGKILAFFIIAPALAVGGTVLNDQLKPLEISQTTIVQKFQASTLKDRYVSEGSSFREAVKPDWKEKTEVRIGEETATEFKPSFELRKWDEVRLKLTPKLETVASKDKDLKITDKLEYKNGSKEELHFYDLPVSEANPEGAYEIEWILNEKSSINKVEFDIDTEGLDFFYQPELTQEEKDQGADRPENVVGSYAVYASENKINYVGGKEYKTGKVGHIFRPNIIDSAGTEVWGDLHIENGILSVTIPQDFLDNAIYPVRHAAGLTFGYTTLGAFNYGPDINSMMGGSFVAGSTGTLASMTIGANDLTPDNVKGVITDTAYSILTNGVTAGVALPTTKGWTAATNFATPPSVTSGTEYVLFGAWSGNINQFWYDLTPAVNYGGNDTTNSYASPQNPTGLNTGYKRSFSIYATYTAGGGEATAPAQDVFWFE